MGCNHNHNTAPRKVDLGRKTEDRRQKTADAPLFASLTRLVPHLEISTPRTTLEIRRGCHFGAGMACSCAFRMNRSQQKVRFQLVPHDATRPSTADVRKDLRCRIIVRTAGTNEVVPSRARCVLAHMLKLTSDDERSSSLPCRVPCRTYRAMSWLERTRCSCS